MKTEKQIRSMDFGDMVRSVKTYDWNGKVKSEYPQVILTGEEIRELAVAFGKAYGLIKDEGK